MTLLANELPVHDAQTAYQALMLLRGSLAEFLELGEDEPWPELLARFGALIARFHSLLRKIATLQTPPVRAAAAPVHAESGSESDESASPKAAAAPVLSAFADLAVVPHEVLPADPELAPRVLLRTKLVPKVEAATAALDAAAEAAGLDAAAAALQRDRLDKHVERCSAAVDRARRQIQARQRAQQRSGQLVALLYLSGDSAAAALPPAASNRFQLASRVVRLVEAIDLGVSALERQLKWQSDGPDYRPRLQSRV